MNGKATVHTYNRDQDDQNSGYDTHFGGLDERDEEDVALKTDRMMIDKGPRRILMTRSVAE